MQTLMTTLAALLFLTGMANATCLWIEEDTAEFETKLVEKYNERPVLMAKKTPGGHQLYVTYAANGSFTVYFNTPDGRSCVMFIGGKGSSTAFPPPVEGSLKTEPEVLEQNG